jgi:hypothetical protein
MFFKCFYQRFPFWPSLSHKFYFMPIYYICQGENNASNRH